MGSFLLGSAKIPRDFSCGVRTGLGPHSVSHSWDGTGDRWSFGAGPLLRRGFAATTELLYCTELLLTMGEPLLIKAIELGPVQHPISLERTLTVYSGASGENPGP